MTREKICGDLDLAGWAMKGLSKCLAKKQKLVVRQGDLDILASEDMIECCGKAMYQMQQEPSTLFEGPPYTISNIPVEEVNMVPLPCWLSQHSMHQRHPATGIFVNVYPPGAFTGLHTGKDNTNTFGVLCS